MATINNQRQQRHSHHTHSFISFLTIKELQSEEGVFRLFEGSCCRYVASQGRPLTRELPHDTICIKKSEAAKTEQSRRSKSAARAEPIKKPLPVQRPARSRRRRDAGNTGSEALTAPLLKAREKKARKVPSPFGKIQRGGC